MHNLKKYLVAFLSAALIACQSSQVKTTIEPFDPQANTYHGVSGNILDVEGFWWASAMVSINPLKVVEENGETDYFLVLDYSAIRSWLWIEAGETLVMNIDGQHIVFFSPYGSSTSRDAGYPNKVRERAIYKITVENLMRISTADQIEVKVIGELREIKCKFNKTGIAAFAEFVGKQLNKSSGAHTHK